MPQAGTTGPMTLLGTCIVNMAELLSASCSTSWRTPAARSISGVGSAVADMRTGGYIALEPGDRAHQPDLPGDEPASTGCPRRRPACPPTPRRPNFQAGLRGRHDGLAAALAGADSLIAAGGLDGVQISSLAKYVLDNDQIGALRRYLREDPIDETTALMDDILEVGIGGHFLGRRSTRAYSRTRGLAAAGVPARHVRGVRRAAARRSEAAERAHELLADARGARRCPTTPTGTSTTSSRGWAAARPTRDAALRQDSTPRRSTWRDRA